MWGISERILGVVDGWKRSAEGEILIVVKTEEVDVQPRQAGLQRGGGFGPGRKGFVR